MCTFTKQEPSLKKTMGNHCGHMLSIVINVNIFNNLLPLSGSDNNIVVKL
jgi:hypothetical protein